MWYNVTLLHGDHKGTEMVEALTAAEAIELQTERIRKDCYAQVDKEIAAITFSAEALEKPTFPDLKK